MSRSIGIDEEGAIAFDGVRVEDEKIGAPLLNNLYRHEKDRFLTKWEDQDVLVEAFDEPLVARHVTRSGATFKIQTMYGLEKTIELESLCVDEWDRFHGLVENKIPFVFSRTAQMEFFDLVDEFDDDGVSIGDERIEIPPFFITDTSIRKENFWTNLYETETPGWELGEPAKPLLDILPQIKLSKSRVLVTACGTGQDAAYLAKQGHVVTGVDFSAEAIDRAKKNFGDIPNLDFIQADLFNMKVTQKYDLIFDHACFNAIDPTRRNDLVQLWRNSLVSGGHLLGIFFMMSKRSGPPFGASEWEMRERLKKGFRFLYWTRWRNSIPRREGRELVIFAQKTSS